MTFANQMILQCDFHIIICIIVLTFTVFNVFVQLYKALRKQCCQWNPFKVTPYISWVSKTT